MTSLVRCREARLSALCGGLTGTISAPQSLSSVMHGMQEYFAEITSAPRVSSTRSITLSRFPLSSDIVVRKFPSEYAQGTSLPSAAPI